MVFKYLTVILYLFKGFFIFHRIKIRQNLQSKRVRRMKHTHLEVNYKTLKAVKLYEPQQIQFPYRIDADLTN
jgi:hypothetical protein